MTELISRNLKKLRLMQGISQKTLAAKSGVNVQTISRLERGAPPKGRKSARGIRSHTIEGLSGALNVSPAVLRGTEPIPEPPKTENLWDAKSLLSVRIDTAARNSLSIVARRYGVSPAAILAIAPLLFVDAAEASLRARRARIEEYERLLDAVSSTRAELKHLPIQAFSTWQAEEAVAVEKESVEKRDLFGETKSVNANMLDYMHDGDTENPFAHYLDHLAAQSGGLISFDSWSGGQSDPSYTLCKADALELVGGESAAADYLLSGFVGIHELPKDLRAAERREDRAKWILERASQKAQELPDLGIDLDKILGPQTTQAEEGDNQS